MEQRYGKENQTVNRAALKIMKESGGCTIKDLAAEFAAHEILDSNAFDHADFRQANIKLKSINSKYE